VGGGAGTMVGAKSRTEWSIDYNNNQLTPYFTRASLIHLYIVSIDLQRIRESSPVSSSVEVCSLWFSKKKISRIDARLAEVQATPSMETNGRLVTPSR
jgi:hypothetical protein